MKVLLVLALFTLVATRPSVEKRDEDEKKFPWCGYLGFQCPTIEKRDVPEDEALNAREEEWGFIGHGVDAQKKAAELEKREDEDRYCAGKIWCGKKVEKRDVPEDEALNAREEDEDDYCAGPICLGKRVEKRDVPEDEALNAREEAEVVY